MLMLASPTYGAIAFRKVRRKSEQSISMVNYLRVYKASQLKAKHPPPPTHTTPELDGPQLVGSTTCFLPAVFFLHHRLLTTFHSTDIKGKLRWLDCTDNDTKSVAVTKTSGRLIFMGCHSEGATG
jgi:hypothetical protein